MPDYDAIHNPCYFGRGKVHFTAPLRPDGAVNMQAYGGRWGDNWASVPATPGVLRLPPGRFVGNARGLTVLPQVERANVSDWDTRDNVIVQGVEASLTLYGHGAQNLADALHALRTQVAGSPLTEQFATSRASVEAGSMIFTRHLVDLAQPFSVTPSWTVWTEGVHWEREAFGVRLLSGFSGPVGSTLAVGYTPEGGADTLEALGSTGIELGLVYAGVNRATGQPVRLDCYRAQPLLSEGVQAISETAGAVTLKFNLRPVRPSTATRASWYRVLRGAYPIH